MISPKRDMLRNLVVLAHPDGKSAWLDQGGAQGGGIGGRLLSRALERAPALGLTTLVGFIFAHNGPSVALFEGLRFARWGHLPRVARLDGVERDLLILGRRLD